MEPDFLGRIRFLVAESAYGERPLQRILEAHALDVVTVQDEAALSRELALGGLLMGIVEQDAPDLDGLALLRRLKAHHDYVPLVVTGRNPVGLLETVMELNLAHPLRGPVDEARFMAEVARCARLLYRRCEEQRRLEQERVLAELLRLALVSEAVEDFLRRSLARLLERITWLGVLPKGAVFLVDPQAGRLRVVAGHRLDPESASTHLADAEGPGSLRIPLTWHGKPLGLVLLVLPGERLLLESDEEFLERVGHALSLGVAHLQGMETTVEPS